MIAHLLIFTLASHHLDAEPNDHRRDRGIVHTPALRDIELHCGRDNSAPTLRCNPLTMLLIAGAFNRTPLRPLQ